DDVRRLMTHAAFRLSNPNKLRALIGALAMRNPVAFHRADGAGYRLVGEVLEQLDEINPQIGARLATCFNRWRAFDDKRSAMMKEQLQKLAARKGLSPDIGEIVTAALKERSEEHTSELQSRFDLVCRLLLEKKKHSN